MQGWRRLVEAVGHAATFEELREAGERYGKVMGQNAARAFVMLATAAIGSTVGLAVKGPRLPGSSQAALLAESQGGFRFMALAEVESVAVSAEGAFTIALAPGAVAMSAQDAGRGLPAPVDAKGHEHHIATNKWWSSTDNGGPWSPRFQKLFAKAGMLLDDAANKVYVQGHKGPHPREYHEEVFRRLQDATRGCRSVQQCRETLTAELKNLTLDISTQGTRLNKLVTRSK